MQLVKTNLQAKPKTKIVCTLGPATESDETVRDLITTGMSVARLNLSHGSPESHEAAIKRVRKASDELGVAVGIMVDVPGPKYRTGYQEPGVIDLLTGATLVLTSRELMGNPDILCVSPFGIHRDATIGGTILIDDGNVQVIVTDIQDQDVICRVTHGGRVVERRGVTTPGKAPDLPFLDDRAKAGLIFAAKMDADFVALSNVTADTDIRQARDLLRKHGPEPYIISKIERAEALEDFDSILEASDAIMVARGDMGVEVPLELVPVYQKKLIARCNEIGKPVITATQMLESMISSQTPTRAEVTDVANAVYDGTDAVMLSGETATGENPVRAVEVMRNVALHAEANLPYASMIRNKEEQLENQTDDAISYDACRTAFQLGADLIVTFTESGATAGRVSKYRPISPILALTPHASVRRVLTLTWGVIPVIASGVDNVEDFFVVGERHALASGHIPKGRGTVVLVAGLPIGVTGGTNLLRVMDVPSSTGADS
ncbi:MAG: pyruvate kinase [Chloroflexi bacterium]|nr:pyruvate kinase [Chloroflexota bacterium]